MDGSQPMFASRAIQRWCEMDPTQDQNPSMKVTSRIDGHLRQTPDRKEVQNFPRIPYCLPKTSPRAAQRPPVLAFVVTVENEKSADGPVVNCHARRWVVEQKENALFDTQEPTTRALNDLSKKKKKKISSFCWFNSVRNTQIFPSRTFRRGIHSFSAKRIRYRNKRQSLSPMESRNALRPELVMLQSFHNGGPLSSTG